MAFDGSGNYIRNYNWSLDAANGVPITASRFDTEHNGFATGLSNCITRDGQGKPIADIDWNSHKIKNAQDPSLPQDYVTLNFLNGTSGLLTINSTVVKIAQTPAELAASVTPVNLYYLPGQDKRYGVIGDGTTDDTTAVNNWFKVSASHKAIGTPKANYLVKSLVTIPGDNCQIDLNGATLVCDVGAGNIGVDFTLPGGTRPPVSGSLVGFITLKTGLIGLNIRSNSWYYNCVVTVNATADATATGVAFSGTSAINGPYYNYGFISVAGTSTGTQTGVKCIGSGGTVRTPNANEIVFPNINGFTTDIEICGHGNKFFACIQGGTTGVKFTLPAATQTTQNIVTLFYVENPTTAVSLVAGCLNNHVNFGYITGVTTLFSDSDGSNTYTDSSNNMRFANQAVADTRLLDWYEEGTSTPTIAGAGTAGTQTYSAQVCNWQRIGNRVNFQIYILMTAKDGATAGLLHVTGLPYAANSGANNNAVCTAAGRVDLDAGYSWFSGVISPSNSFLFLVESGDNVATTVLAAANLVATTELYLSGSYQV